MIPQNVIDDILNKVSIVDVVGRFTEIRKSGKNHLALCPFHKEKTPSFSISEDKGLYHCFGCGASGNTLKFLMEYQKLTFLEAVQDLAKMAGVDLSRFANSPSDGYSSKEKETLLAINREAMLFYHKSLLTDEPAAPAREYLKNRKLTLETVKTYRLGFGGVSWTGLLAYLKEKGFTDQDAVNAGLAIEGKNGPYDRFKDRLIFPIFDRDANTVGFGGRILTDAKDAAKYINTSENRLFRKGTLLFSLHLAKDEIVREKRCVLAEGYMDVIALHQNGVKNAVAPLGTSFTAEQLALLRRYADTVFFVFDGDGAGIAAANRAIDLAASESGLTQWAVILPQKQDPFDFVMDKGAGGFLEYLEQKKLRPVEFKLRFFSRSVDPKTQKVKFLAQVFPYLSRLKSPVAREEALKTTASFVKEDYAVVLSEYQSFLANAKDFGRAIREKDATRSEAGRTETIFAGLLVLFPELAEEAGKILDTDMLESPAIRSVYEHVRSAPGRSTKDIVNALENLGAPEVLAVVSEYAQKEELQRPELVRELAYRLKLSYIKKQMGRNARDIAQSETRADFDSVKRLMKEKQDLVAAAAETEKLFKGFEVY